MLTVDLVGIVVAIDFLTVAGICGGGGDTNLEPNDTLGRSGLKHKNPDHLCVKWVTDFACWGSGKSDSRTEAHIVKISDSHETLPNF